jgi:hypothetical protein
VNTAMNLRAPQKVENFLTSWVTISFSSRTVLHAVWKMLLHKESITPPNFNWSWRQDNKHMADSPNNKLRGNIFSNMTL